MLTAMCVILSAHVGSPDAWFEGNAGPYKLTVQVQMPGVVPGVAQVFVRIPGEQVDRVTVLGNKFDATGGTPPPEVAEHSRDDPSLYVGKLWLMTIGSNSVTVEVKGPKGSGKVVIPVVNVALRRLAFDPRLGVGLSAIGLFLFIGLVTIVGAAVRESAVGPGDQPSPRHRSRARAAMAGTSIGLALLLFGGWKWWNSEDARFSRTLFKPFKSSAGVEQVSGFGKLVFRIDDSAWTHRSDVSIVGGRRRSTGWTPLIPDHGKLMHLFLVRDDLGAFAHLHPVTTDSVVFTSTVPRLPTGHYRVFADVVHESGYAQTMITSLSVPRSIDEPRISSDDPDDSWYFGSGGRGSAAVELADGSTMTWLGAKTPIVPGRQADLRFEIKNSDGTPAMLEPYMGMAGHAVVMRSDGSVFVHLHPSGTISMASQMAFEMRQPSDTSFGQLGARITAEEKSGAPMVQSRNVVSFPYAFPKAGRYRMWVQVRRNGGVLTGTYDIDVSSGVKSAG